MPDERHGLPSASAIERYEACPGSFNLSKGVEADIRTDDEKEWGDAGDRIHAWLEDHDLVELPPEELQVAENCNRQAVDFLVATFEGRPFTTEKEQRVWATVVDTSLELWKETGAKTKALGRPRRFSGRADVFAISNDREIGAVIDYKPQRRQALESQTNLQLRSLALLLWLKYDRQPKRISVAIVQPFVGEPTRVVYEQEDLVRAEKQLVSILRSLDQPEAHLEPGPQCRYCPASLACPRVKETIQAIADSKPISADAQMLSALLSLCEIAEPKIKQIRANAKGLLKSGKEVPGWTLKPNAPTREITDVLGAFNALLKAEKIDRDTFLRDCTSVGLGDLEKAIAKRLEITGAQAKDTVNGCCAPFINLKPKDASLTRITNGPQ